MVRATVISCVLLAVTGFNAPEAKSEDPIGKRYDFRCENQRVDSMLAAISKRFRVHLIADHGELQKSGMELANLRVSCDLSDATLSEVAEAVLRPHKLVCIDRYGCMLVTTHEAATRRYFDTRVYQLRKRMKVERRLQTIMWSAAPRSWLLTGGSGDAAAFSSDKILIYQSAANHREIADMFHKSVVRISGHDLLLFHQTTSLEHILAKPGTLNFQGKTLLETVKAITESAHVVVKFETTALQSKIANTNIGAASSLGGGLSLMLELIDPSITWIIKDDELLITTHDAASAEFQKITYDLRKTIDPDEMNQLIEAIEYTIATDCWETVGGDASIVPTDENRRLVIEASYPVHRLIRQVLADIVASQYPGKVFNEGR